MNRIMLDLETLSTRPNAAIVSIGAVHFDEELGISDQYYAVLDTNEQVRRLGRDVDPGTFAWWCQRSEEARAVFKNPGDRLVPTLLDFSAFVHRAGPQGEVEMWGNGADFDCVVLGGLYEAAGLPKPWSYSKNRCFRTLKNLGIKLGDGEGLVRVGAHNALEDAKYQAHYAIAYLRKLNGQ